MRILVCPHLMEVGGSQLNAIELAEAVRDRGHDVVIYAPPGVLVEEVRRRQLEYVAASTRRMVPSPVNATRLDGLVRSRQFDLIHAYEWNTLLDAMYGPGWTFGTPVVSTIMSMSVPYFLPRSVPMIVGTRQLVRQEARWRPEVYLMEPPIDMRRNNPSAFEPAEVDAVRERWDIPDDSQLVVVVGRIAHELKLEGLLSAASGLCLVDPRWKPTLLIVGDGPARGEVEARAEETNRRLGRKAVLLAGEVGDPRPVYMAADVAIGMGGSIMRALAFGKPAIVQGEQGFWTRVTAETQEIFLEQGWYGTGPGAEQGSRNFARMLEETLADLGSAEVDAQNARRRIAEEASLDRAATWLSDLYERVATRRVPASVRFRTQAATTWTLLRRSAAVAAERRGWR